MSMLILYPKKGATINWSFLGSLPSPLTFSRASTGIYTNAAGALVSAASGAPRFAFDPVTHAPKGLLLEGQVTNTIYPSVPDATWTQNRTVTTANQTTSPDGTANASLLVDDSSSNTHYIITANTTSFTIGANYALSVYAKAASSTALQLSFGSASHGVNAYANFDLSAGTVGTIGSTATAYIENAGNSWYRCSIVSAATITAATFGYFILTNSSASASRLPTYSGTGTGVYLYGAQLEASNDMATSYIPTTTATATRAKDYLYTTSLQWLNAAEGAFCIEVTPTYSGSTYPPLLRVRKSTDAENTRIGLHYNRTTKTAGYSIVDAGAFQADQNTGATNIVYGTTIKSAFRYKQNNFIGALGGTLYGVDNAGNVPSVLDEMYFQTSSSVGGMYLRKLSYWNRGISNAELQRATQ